MPVLHAASRKRLRRGEHDHNRLAAPFALRHPRRRLAHPLLRHHALAAALSSTARNLHRSLKRVTTSYTDHSWTAHTAHTLIVPARIKFSVCANKPQKTVCTLPVGGTALLAGDRIIPPWAV